PDSSEDEAPEEVAFGVAKEAAEIERKLVGEAARRDRELLKEKRRRRQELFTEQKVRGPFTYATVLSPCGRTVLPPHLTSLSLAETEASPRGRPTGAVCSTARTVRGRSGRAGGAGMSIGNYMAVCLKDQSVTGLHQQLAKDFLNTQLYGPGTNRVQANEFFSLENKKNPVKKAAVQFVDKSWG
ncbi:NOL7 protein, partial [Semnornis frantzii]|nr:NOL7 protein [Semnornis frantzii]